MRQLVRIVFNRAFTALAAASVLLMTVALVVILGPIFWRGSSAVIFRGTVEYRAMMLGEFHRGDTGALQAEMQAAHAARAPVYAILDEFRRGIDTGRIEDQINHAYRQLRPQLDNRVAAGRITEEQADALRSDARAVRNAIRAALETTDSAEALAHLDEALSHPARPALTDTVAAGLFSEAQRYRQIAQTVDLGRRDVYLAEFQEATAILRELLGPRPGDPVPLLAEMRYGATRWDRASILLDRLLYDSQWQAIEPGQPLVEARVRRAEVFEGTVMAELFPLMEQELPAMLRPERTFYWRYFIDPSTPGNLFGGVGKEMYGTILLTIVPMVVAFPIGLVCAAYLVECARESLFIRVIRTCINTLAGVPSIVFGLFGLAFFVMWLQPALGLPRDISILAGGLTLAVLVLPILIRASEEAIRSVPPTYKEASLALGAGGLRTFLAVTFPAALPGVLTGVILSMSRAAGETAVVLFTAAVAVRAGFPDGLLDQTLALPVSAYFFATADNLAQKAPHNQYGMVMALVGLVLVLNVAAILVRSRVSRKLRGQ